MNIRLDKFTIAFSRFALFLVYFWFGSLKILETSPASEMVLGLLDKTIPFMNKELFLIMFGSFEVLIGLLFLIPRLDKLSLILLGFHLSTAMLPLFLMSQFTWSNFLVPTLEGQYILKNVLIISAGLNIMANLRKIKS